MQFHTYDEAKGYLEEFIKSIRYQLTPTQIKNDPLARMRKLVELLSNPQDSYPSILIAGTSGKGSTTYLISHILETAGFKVGTTISPSIGSIKNRILINNIPITSDEFTVLVNEVYDAVEQTKKEMGDPSFFEILIAMAFLHFKKAKVDFAVVEVGLGGEYDATNVIYPLVSVVTNIGLDHTEILGKTIKKIAKAKAGILKSAKVTSLNNQFIGAQPILVTAATQSSALLVLKQKAKDVGAKTYIINHDFRFRVEKQTAKEVIFSFMSDRIVLSQLVLGMIGRYQAENASVAIEVVEQLKTYGFSVSEEIIRKALKTARLPGRFEEIKYNNSTYILDSAHNPIKIKSFVEALQKIYPSDKKVFVIAFKNTKDVVPMIKKIATCADTIIFTEFKLMIDTMTNMAMTVEDLQFEIQNLKLNNCYFEKNAQQALTMAKHIAGQEGLVIVTGSMYLVSEVRNILLDA